MRLYTKENICVFSKSMHNIFKMKLVNKELYVTILSTDCWCWHLVAFIRKYDSHELSKSFWSLVLTISQIIKEKNLLGVKFDRMAVEFKVSFIGLRFKIFLLQKKEKEDVYLINNPLLLLNKSLNIIHLSTTLQYLYIFSSIFVLEKLTFV